MPGGRARPCRTSPIDDDPPHARIVTWRRTEGATNVVPSVQISSLPMREIDELQVQTRRGIEVPHVGPDDVRLAVRAVRETDVVAVEPRAGLASGRSRSRIEEHRLPRVRGRRAHLLRGEAGAS